MPFANLARATCAATAIISLSFSRGVRFTSFSDSNTDSARPHLRHVKWHGSLSAKLLKQATQGCLQRRGRTRGKSANCNAADDRRSAEAIARSGEIAD